MKIFAVIIFAVIVASISAKEEEDDLGQAITKILNFHEKEKYIAGLFANPDLTELNAVSSPSPASKKKDILGGLHGIPSCKLGSRWGNPICFIKCIFRRHAGGVCKDKTCICVD